MTRTDATLWDCLDDFRHRFNQNPRVKKIIKDWNRSIVVECLDTGEALTLVIRDLEVTEILPYAAETHESRILLQANQDIHKQIFTGIYNPSHALMDGAIAVFASDRDQVKLEAIAMVTWGI